VGEGSACYEVGVLLRRVWMIAATLELVKSLLPTKPFESSRGSRLDILSNVTQLCVP